MQCDHPLVMHSFHFITDETSNVSVQFCIFFLVPPYFSFYIGKSRFRYITRFVLFAMFQSLANLKPPRVYVESLKKS